METLRRLYERLDDLVRASDPSDVDTARIDAANAIDQHVESVVADALASASGPLSRRDRFAMAAMQGWRASNYAHNGHSPSSEMIAEWAREDADALIAEFDKQKDGAA